MDGEKLLVVNATYPVGSSVPDAGWTAYVTNRSTSETGHVTVWPTCAAATTGLHQHP